jgi:hypothetical protein
MPSLLNGWEVGAFCTKFNALVRALEYDETFALIAFERAISKESVCSTIHEKKPRIH